MAARQFFVKAGPIAVAVVGGSVAATSTATVLVALGAAVAVGAVGYGVYRYFGLS